MVYVLVGLLLYNIMLGLGECSILIVCWEHVIPFNARKMKVSYWQSKNKTFCYISILKIILDSIDLDSRGRERASAKIYAHMSATQQNLVATPLPPHIYISRSAPGLI